MSVKRTILPHSFLLDTFLIAFLCFWLIKPLFTLTYLDNFASIESTFIAEGRMLSEHLPHPGWQPLWYCGTRTDYIYPPAVPYGTALISRFAHVEPARAYHLYIAVFYVFGIAAVYWLARVGSGSRGAGWLAAAATALLSPSFLLLKAIRIDSGFRVPQRLHVLMSYGEGPHIAAVCVLPAALAAVFVALRRSGSGPVIAAGALCALVVANNFYGATALAIMVPLMVWSVWVGERRGGVWIRAWVIVIISYGLCAFWLTPSYLRITVVDLKWVSQPGNLRSLMAIFAAALLYGLLSFRWANRKPEREWPLFLAGAALIVCLYVLGFYYFHLRVTGEPARLIPELDLVLILSAVEVTRRLWNVRLSRIPIALLVLLAFAASVPYLSHVWSPFPRTRAIGEVYEYKTARWVENHLEGARVLPSGSVRFWFDAWADNGQPDGGSLQGMLNQMIPLATWEITHGAQPALSILWLKALGTDAVVVPDQTSPEPYHDYSFPSKFRGVVPVLEDDGHGTVIYGIPRIHPGIARVVNSTAIIGAGEISGANTEVVLTRYVAAVENPAQHAAKLKWHSFDEAEIEADAQPGESVLVQETWDPAWHAEASGKALNIQRDPVMGFMLISVPAGQNNFLLRFDTPLENRVGQFIFALTLAGIAGSTLWRNHRSR